MAEVCRSLPEATYMVVRFDVDIAIVKPKLTGEAEPNRASDGWHWN